MDGQIVPSCNNSDPLQQSRYRGNYFACVIYPQEDPNHAKFLDYVQSRPQYQIAYITHEADDEVPKEHTHLLIHVRQSITVGSFVKFFDPWIKYAECVKNKLGYLAYMIHDTPHSLEDGKKPYSIDDFHGDSSLWKELVQKSNFVQFGVFLSYFEPGVTVLEILNRIRDDLGENAYEQYFEYVRSNAFFIQNLLRDETNEARYRQKLTR